MDDSKDTRRLQTFIQRSDPPTNFLSDVHQEQSHSLPKVAGNEHAHIYSMDRPNEGQRSFWVNGQNYSIRGPTPPPIYRERASSPSEMTVDPYSARVSSLGHQNNAHYRWLDRRKDASADKEDYEDYASEDSEEREFRESKALKYSIAYEGSSPKRLRAHRLSPFPHDRPGGPSKPLVSYVKNDWRYEDPRHPRPQSPPQDDICPEGWLEIVCSSAFKRWMVLYLVLMAAAWIWWFNYYGPKYIEDNFLKDSLKARAASHSGHFGMNRRVSFAGLTQLSHLDRRLVPGSETKGAKKRRLVIVGDIHGCLDELNSLLDQTKFDPQKDHLIATGDVISKGPESAAVLDVLILNNASSVRGNHEDKILLAHRDLHAPSHQKYISSEPSPSAIPGPVLLKHGASSDLQLAASLTDDQVRYVTSWPLILSLGPISGFGNVSIVHAGLTPGVSLMHQDPISVMNMRSIDLRNHIPSSRPAPVEGVDVVKRKDYDPRNRVAIKPWTVLWNAWQDMQPKKERQTVVYGHDSKKGVLQKAWSLGLDGGCVKGGKLTALVIEETARGDVTKQVVGVPCKDYLAEKVLRPLGEN